jgi:hypothetical protein
MPAFTRQYDPLKTGPVCPFAPRGCNPRCRAYIKEGDKCRILEWIEQRVRAGSFLTDGMEDETKAINQRGEP